MTYLVRLEQDALDQLAGIEDYIAELADPRTAASYAGQILATCHNLATFPHRGRARDDIRPGLRITGFRRRVTIAFTVDDSARLVSIVGVFFGGQDWESRLT